MNSRCLRILSVLLALNLLPACPAQDDNDEGSDAGHPTLDSGTLPGDGGSLPDAGSPTDAGTGGQDAGTPADAGTPITSCDQVPDKGCFSNEECGLAEHCTDFGTGTSSCCVPGARGERATGAGCTDDEQCAFGVCVERDGDDKSFCSGACESDPDCPIATMYCGSFFGWCVPRDAGAQPESCEQLSLAQCFSNDPCEDNERCEDLDTTEETEVLCCTVGARGTKGVGEACASGLECSYGRCIGGLCTADCDYDNDPCPPETMECNYIRFLCEPL